MVVVFRRFRQFRLWGLDVLGIRIWGGGWLELVMISSHDQTRASHSPLL